MKKNTSYKKGVVKIENVEHCHFFHTYNSQGRKLDTTNAVGRHFHNIVWKVDKNGEMVAKCGPALTKKVRRTPIGQRTDIVPVQWMDEIANKMVIDDHTHSMTYLHSEDIDANRARSIQQIVPPEAELASKAKELGMESGF